MANEDHIRDLLQRDIEWLEKCTEIKVQGIDRVAEIKMQGIDRHAQAQITNIEKATQVAMDALNERLKGWPGKMDAMEKQVAQFKGQAMVFGGIAGSVVSLVASVIAGVIIYRAIGG